MHARFNRIKAAFWLWIADIRRRRRLGVLALFGILVEETLRHRLFAWVNDQIDIYGPPMIKAVFDAVLWIGQSPLGLTGTIVVFVLLSLFVHAYVTAPGSPRPFRARELTGFLLIFCALILGIAGVRQLLGTADRESKQAEGQTLALPGALSSTPPAPELTRESKSAVPATASPKALLSEIERRVKTLDRFYGILDSDASEVAEIASQVVLPWYRTSRTPAPLTIAAVKALAPTMGSIVAKGNGVIEKIDEVMKPYPHDPDLWTVVGDYKAVALISEASGIRNLITTLPDDASAQIINLVLEPHTSPYQNASTAYDGWIRASKARIEQQRRLELAKLN